LAGLPEDQRGASYSRDREREEEERFQTFLGTLPEYQRAQALRDREIFNEIFPRQPHVNQALRGDAYQIHRAAKNFNDPAFLKLLEKHVKASTKLDSLEVIKYKFLDFVGKSHSRQQRRGQA
jgi:aromatic ring hydroxylase